MKVFFRFIIFQSLCTFPLFACKASTVAISASYNNSSAVPVTASTYTATGKSINFTLDYAPTIATPLTVVNNTGLGFIQGVFENLSQGQKVSLTYSGISYDFTANYYGGNGNDLVLQWSSGRVLAWGENKYGQLGNNNTTNSSTAVAVAHTGILSGKTLVAISAGYSHSLALSSDGMLFAWGLNHTGQLGNNSTSNSSVPVAVNQAGGLLGKMVIAIAAGQNYCLALCADGAVYGWGDNGVGQLGNNSSTSSGVPVAVERTGILFGKTVVAISAGAFHSLALCSDGSVVSWGHNFSGQLGNGSNTRSSLPVAVSKITVLSGKTVIAISAGGGYQEGHSLALCSDGTLAAWGLNSSGQLGNNSNLNSNIPVLVSRNQNALSNKTVVSIAGGSNSSIVMCSDGTIAAWGFNRYGHLGNNSVVSSSVPVAVIRTGVLSNKTIKEFNAQGESYMALSSDGTLTGWGLNYGQFGVNKTINSKMPVIVEKSLLKSGECFSAICRGTQSSHCLVITSTIPSVVFLTINSPIHGSILERANEGGYILGVNTTLTATPDAGFVFTGWTGDANGNTNPLSLLMDKNKIVGGTFAPDTNDDDSDGLSNYDEIINYGTDPKLTDTDGDGYQDATEATLGSNSLINNSVPVFQLQTKILSNGGDFQVSFPAQQGVPYTLQESLNLVDWENIETGISGQGAVITRNYLIITKEKQYLRLRKN